MSTTFAIVSFIHSLPEGKVFTSRDLIGIGPRGAMDQCLSRLAKAGALQRLARGVYCSGSEQPTITPHELAQIKARAFHKEVYEDAGITAQRLVYTPKSEGKEVEHIFASSGSSNSSFNSVFGKITLKAVSARKRHDDKNEVWEVLKALSSMGKQIIPSRIASHIVELWGRQSQESFQKYASYVPQWLYEQFPQDYKVAFKTLCANSIALMGGVLNSPPTPKERDEIATTAMNLKASKNLPPGKDARINKISPNTHHQQPRAANCWCPPDDPRCVCPEFTCQGCQTQPIRNKFSLRFG